MGVMPKLFKKEWKKVSPVSLADTGEFCFSFLFIKIIYFQEDMFF